MKETNEATPKEFKEFLDLLDDKSFVVWLTFMDELEIKKIKEAVYFFREDGKYQGVKTPENPAFDFILNQISYLTEKAQSDACTMLSVLLSRTTKTGKLNFLKNYRELNLGKTFPHTEDLFRVDSIIVKLEVALSIEERV